MRHAIAAFALCAALAAPAADPAPTPPPAAKPSDVFEQAPAPAPRDDWTFFQIGFFPGVPSGTQDSNVYGLKLGAPMVDGLGRVYGLEPSIFYSGTNYVEGFQGAWFGAAIGRQLRGVQASMVGPCMAKEFWGLQASLVNIAAFGAGFQPGLVNCAEEFYGFQAGGVNRAKSLRGFQAGVLANVAEERFDGVQLGVVNYAKGAGCQFGLVNIMEDGPLPFMILFNCSF